VVVVCVRSAGVTGAVAGAVCAKAGPLQLLAALLVLSRP
jgi:hypothetical protein